MILSIMDSLTKMSDKIRDWFITHGSNPIIWICIFFGGLCLFLLLYSYLRKGHS